MLDPNCLLVSTYKHALSADEFEEFCGNLAIAIESGMRVRVNTDNIDAAMCWGDSPQGHDYWQAFNNNTRKRLDTATLIRQFTKRNGGVFIGDDGEDDEEREVAQEDHVDF